MGTLLVQGGTLRCNFVQATTNNTLSMGGAGVNWPCEYGLDTAQRYIYLNGGTLKARSTDTTFIWPQMTRVTVGPGGAVFDTNGRTMTLPATLQAPAGKGMASVPFTCSEAWRYIGSPFIKITGLRHGDIRPGKAGNRQSRPAVVRNRARFQDALRLPERHGAHLPLTSTSCRW